MTIEIKQLIIRAVVDGPRERAAGPDGTRGRLGAEPVRHTTPAAPADTAVNRESMIAECMRYVLRELQRGRGR
jgi:hypothetical protein